MDCFPLYDTLNSNLPKKDLSVKQKEEFIHKISDADTKAQEILFALICYHAKKTIETLECIPYKCDRDDDGNYVLNLSNIPIPLRHMLYKFIVLHEESAN